MSDMRSLRRHLALLEGFPVELLDAEGHWVPGEVPAPPDAFAERASPDQMTVGEWEDEFTTRCGGALRPLVLLIDAPAKKRSRLRALRRRDPHLWERSLHDGPFHLPADPVALLVGDRGRLDHDGPQAEGVLRIRLPWNRPTATVLITEPFVDPQLETYAAADLELDSGWLRVTDSRRSFRSDTPAEQLRVAVVGHPLLAEVFVGVSPISS